MMVLGAVVAVVGVVAVLDLLLTVGVVRRLREHTERLSEIASGGAAGRPPARLAAGLEIGEFAAVTTGGDAVSRGALEAETLVGFFSATCKPCKALLPLFVDHAAALPGGGDRVVAVVDGTGDEADALVASLLPVARVVVERFDGPMTQAFETKAFPSLFVMGDNGVILASGGDIASVRRPVAVGSR